MGGPPELDDPGLVRVQLQRERLQPLLQLGQEPVRIGKVLEAHHHVVGVPHHDHVALRAAQSPAFHPALKAHQDRQ